MRSLLLSKYIGDRITNASYTGLGANLVCSFSFLLGSKSHGLLVDKIADYQRINKVPSKIHDQGIRQVVKAADIH